MPKFLSRYSILLIVCLCSFISQAQPVADFRASDTAGCVPMIVHFTNTSSGGTTYSWDFGNGNFSTSTDASTSYLTAGTYTVTLTATNSGGLTDKKTVVLSAYTAPTVDFFAGSTSICPRAPVTFTSTTTSGAWGSLDYVWNFGDGSSSTLSSPTYSYVPPGYYNITLYATNKAGCVASLTKGTYLRVFAGPRARFSVANSYLCGSPATAVFANGSGGTAPLAYLWSFGDATTTTSSSPSHTYASKGSYTVRLRTTDANGCTDSLGIGSFITVGGLKAGYAAPADACVNTIVTFTDTSQPHISTFWDFNDGTTDDKDITKHVFAAPGKYFVKERVYDGFCYDSVMRMIDIHGAVGSYTVFQPCTPLSVLTFSASAPPFTIINWNFGDGQTGTGTTASNHFGGVGSEWPRPKIVDNSMTIYDTFGCKTTVNTVDTIYNLLLGIKTAEPSLSGCAPFTLNFESVAKSVILNPHPVDLPNDSFLTLPYYRKVAAYTWDFGDGSPTSSLATPAHVFTAVGEYTVTCTVTTTNGCSASNIAEVKVGSMQSATFTMDRTRACTGAPIVYTAHTTSTLIDRYDWGFDDGTSDGGEFASVVVHRSDLPGIHQPLLSVSYNGCSSFPPYMLKDTIDSPGANITFKHVCIPRNGIAFNDTFNGSTSRLWDFGDGTTSTARNPVHLYPALKPYRATLSTYNSRTGCRDTSDVLFYLQRIYKDLIPDHVKICTDEPDTILADIRNVMDTTKMGPPPYTMAVKSVWYLNGTATDTTTPKFKYPGLPPDFHYMTDTNIYPFHLKGVNAIDLVLTDNHGCFDTVSTTILAAKPTATFSSVTTTGCAPVPATHTDMSYSVSGTSITDYYWSFGDGATTSLTTSSVVLHSYTAAGTYIVKEIVVDDVGCTDSFTGSVKPVVFRPIADFTVSDQAACFKNSVSFTNLSVAGTAWLWSFGDGGTSTLARPVYTYTAPGLYTVSLVASDAFGCTDTMKQVDYITIHPLPTARFSMDDSFAVCPPLNVNFSNTSVGAVGFQWSFGDGTFSLIPNPNAIYSSSGYFTVKLTASNLFGCVDTAVGHASTFGYAGAFAYTPKALCTGLPVHFKAAVSGVSGIVWDFGDGTISASSTVDTITHVYTALGKYLPKLFLVDSTGCSKWSTGIDTIKVDTLIPHFTFSPATGCTNAPLAFRDSSYSYFSSSTVWLWSFGSGATSTVSTPAYTYTVAGTHTTTLTVTDGAGCSSTISRSIVVNSAPVPISGSPDMCNGQTTTLTDATPGGIWTSSNTSIATVTAGTVTGTGSGTATISYTLTNGCKETITASVHPLPLPITGAANVCIGQTIRLTNATTGGAWASSNTTVATVGTSGIVTGAAAGTAAITYATGTGCVALKTITVEPSPAPITGTNFVCRGLTASLSNTSPGGTWSSSNTIIASIGSATGIMTGNSVGSLTITYKLATSCISTTTATVNPIPGTINGLTQVCISASATLSNTTSGGTWSSSNTGVATIGSATSIYTGGIAGTATISYTSAQGCSSIQTITVNPAPPAITGSSLVCKGLTTTLSSSTGGTWTSANPAVATIGGSSGVVNAIAAGTATISYTLGTGCGTAMTITVTPLPTAITGATSICEGTSAVLSDAITGGWWTSGNTTIATIGSASGVINGVSAGTARITYTAGNGCEVTTTVTVNVQPAPPTGVAAVCIGLNTMLSSTTAGGTWSTTATVASVGSLSGIVAGAVAGTAVISYTVGSCTAEKTVTVHPLPAAITGIGKLCSGATITMSNSDPGGTWGSLGTTNISVGAATGIVTGISAGTASVTYQLATGCITTRNITVSPLPAPVTGPSTVCVHASVKLSSLTTPGSWASANTAIATIGSTGIVLGISSGTGTITYASTNGCTTTVTITVNPLPADITGITKVCAGLTTTLSDADPGGLWTSSSTTNATIGAASGIVTGIKAGTSAITYQLPTGCATDTVVTIHPLPLATVVPSTVCKGLTITLTNASVPAGTWSTINTSIATIDATTGVTTGIAAGTATVTYTLPTGCQTTATVTVNPLPLPITGTTKQVCAGLTITLSSATVGGTWSSAATNIAVGLTTGIVTGITKGTSTITYTLTTGCFITDSVTVHPLPAAITGATELCLGLTTTLSNTTKPGTWSSTDPVISIDATSGVVTGLATGTATITYQLLTTCLTTTTVTVNELPSLFPAITPICIGATTALSNLVTGGTWASGNISVATIDVTTGIVTGVSAGTASMTYTTGKGCTASTTVTVNPDIPAITGVTTICNGLTTILLNAAKGGIWTSSDITIIKVTSAGVVTGSKPGIADITYTADNYCGIAAIRITVNPQPDAGTITGPGKLCSGTDVVLKNAVNGGTWTSANTTIATIDGNGTVTGIAAGNTSITYSYTNSCGTAETGMAIVVNQTPEQVHITTHPAPELCNNTLYQNFGAESPEPKNMLYKWTVRNGYVYATAKDHQYCLVNFNEPGTAIVTLNVSQANTGCTNTDTLMFRVSDNAVVLPQVVYYAPEFICKDNTSESFQWGYDSKLTLDSTLLAGMVNQNYENRQPDFANKYYWVITSRNGCLRKSYYNAPLSGSSIAQQDLEFLLYPNPAGDIIHIQVKGIIRQDLVEAKLYDVLGRERNTIQLLNGVAVMKLESYIPGVYMVMFTSNGVKIGAKTFIKE